MIKEVKGLLSKLRRCASGNATLLVAAGMPMLIGGTGFAVDTAQWYMWKRELQFATDQAAIAAAWALSDEATQDTYETRGLQEYDNNLATTADYATDPEFTLADFGGGTSNSVIVQASVTRTLPFSSLIMNASTTVSAYSQAQFEEGAEFTSCLVAVDEDDDGAITIGGNSVLTAGCGMAALSTSDTSVVVNGSPTIDAGWVISAGGIDDWFNSNTDDTILEYQTGLYDPYKDLTPPNNATPRTYSCPSNGNGGTPSTNADVTTEVETTYEYYKGASSNTAEPYDYNFPKVGGTAYSGPTNQLVPNGTVAGTRTNTTVTWFNVAGGGSAKVWEKKTTVTTTSYANVVVTAGSNVATVLPGTYASLRLRCDTVFSGGIYVINGGDLDIPSLYTVTGAGVMFVLKNGAGFRINGGSNINLTAMTVSELMAAGVSASEASRLAGMLIYEDPDSDGNTGNMINGNAQTVLNGTIYLPKSNIDFAGTASVTSQCLMIAAATITLTGTTNMTTFCPSGVNNDTTVASTESSVKLVA